MCHTLNTVFFFPGWGKCGGICDVIIGGPTELGEKVKFPFVLSGLDDGDVADLSRCSFCSDGEHCSVGVD